MIGSSQDGCPHISRDEKAMITDSSHPFCWSKHGVGRGHGRAVVLKSTRWNSSTNQLGIPILAFSRLSQILTLMVRIT